MATTPRADSARTVNEVLAEAYSDGIKIAEKRGDDCLDAAEQSRAEADRHFMDAKALRDRLAIISKPPAAKPRGCAVAATIRRKDGTTYQVVGRSCWVQDRCDFAENNGEFVTRVDLL